MRVKSDGIIDWEKPNADFQRMVKLAHLVFSKRTKLIPQSAFIDGAKLFQQDDRVAVKTWDWSIQVHMSRKFMLTFPAGNRGCDHCGTVPIAHIVLENDHRTDSALLGANYRPQVCIVDITPADVLFAVCFHHLHPLFFWLNTTKIGIASLITRSLAGLEW